LTPLAAVGLATIMVLAALFHIGRREWPNVALNLVLGALAGFVAYARYAVPLS
jgi:integral membrane sensor domain MASE1